MVTNYSYQQFIVLWCQQKEKVVKNEPVTSCICIVAQTHNDCLQINPRAYVPGDNIKFNAVVYNTSNQPIRFVQVALIQVGLVYVSQIIIINLFIYVRIIIRSLYHYSPSYFQNTFLRKVLQLIIRHETFDFRPIY